jgi:hypothetical protein
VSSQSIRGQYKSGFRSVLQSERCCAMTMVRYHDTEPSVFAAAAKMKRTQMKHQPPAVEVLNWD